MEIGKFPIPKCRNLLSLSSVLLETRKKGGVKYALLFKSVIVMKQ